MVRLVVLAACALAVGCARPDEGGGAAPGGAAPAAADDALAVYECALRYQLRDRPADAEAFLSVDGRDPPPELLARLRKDWPNLKRKSEEPADKGLRISAGGLEWGGRDRATLRAGYRFPTKFAGQARFADLRLAREGGRWAVAEVTGETVGCG